MKTLLLTALSIVIIMIMSWTPDTEPYKEYDELIAETNSLNDSALMYLKMLHERNDSLLDIYFPKDEEHNQSEK